MTGPNGFGPTRRLPGKADFDRVFARPRYRLRRHPFTLLARPVGGSRARLGLVVGKRHAKRAVDRNRIRRLARETFRQRRFPVAVDVIVLARPGADRCDRAELARSLEWLWNRLERDAVREISRADGSEIAEGESAHEERGA